MKKKERRKIQDLQDEILFGTSITVTKVKFSQKGMLERPTSLMRLP